jgi:hypothetical protein
MPRKPTIVALKVRKSAIVALKALIAHEEKAVSCGDMDVCYTLRPFLKFLEQQRLQCKALMGSTDYHTALELINKSMLGIIRREVCDNILSWQCAGSDYRH